MPCAFRYGLTVGLWPTDARGLVGLGWFCAKPVQVPRCPATHGTPFIVGTGPPDTMRRRTVVTVLVQRFGAGDRSGDDRRSAQPPDQQ